MKQYFDLLGLQVRDKVTAFEGVVTSIGFDLYGCVQAIVNPPMKEPAKLEEGRWFDVKRLEVMNNTPVMEVPLFSDPVEVPGPQEKPIPSHAR